LYVDAAIATSLSFETATDDVSVSSRSFAVVPGNELPIIPLILEGENVLSVTMTIYKPSLWYPRGYGSPTLYKLLSVLLNSNGEVKKIPRNF
jgi:beta-galactosidase/beta-glucuronidase